VAGCCECGDEPSGYCVTELVNSQQSMTIEVAFIRPSLSPVLVFPCHTVAASILLHARFPW
jgi:hypothetical protein